MPKFRRRYFTAMCKACKRTQQMKFVGENLEVGIIWLKCKTCSQAFAFSTEQIRKQLKMISEKKKNERKKIHTLKGKVVEYTPEKTFVVGQQIYHNSFNDVGKVAEKKESDNKKGKIVVRFKEVGEKLLIEGYQSSEEGNSNGNS